MVCQLCEELKKTLKRLVAENAELEQKIHELRERKEREELLHSIRLINAEERMKKEREKCCVS